MKQIKSSLPWTAQIDGPDLVIRNVMATCFGGQYDAGDDGRTESGIMNDGRYPALLGIALPIRSTEAATRPSPLAFLGPHIPWFTTVKVWKESEGEQSAIATVLIDNGPDESKYPTHAMDFNPNVASHFTPAFDQRRLANEWSGQGFSCRILGAARFAPADVIEDV